MYAKLLCIFIGTVPIAISAASTVSAQQNTSLYTSVATKGCQKFDSVKAGDDELGAIYECRGLPGYSVVIGEDDLRTVVAIGFDRAHAKDQPAIMQGFGPFNSVDGRLEWRIDAKTKKPFATIQRWQLADNENLDKDSRPKAVSLLVVTRVPPGPSCHVAYIDVGANEHPNGLARKAADEHAQKFDCANDKVRVIGNQGRATALSGAQ